MAKHSLGRPLDKQPRRRKFPLFFMLLLLWLLGFAFFMVQISSLEEKFEPLPSSTYDAAIVLTGGAGRLQEGAELLRQNRVSKLFISGVHRDVVRDDIRKLANLPRRLADCCLILDKRARNTFQNADQAAYWVRDENYGSIVLITADYHLPRAYFLTKRLLPTVDVRVIAVSTGSDPQFLLLEYHKYLISLLLNIKLGGLGKQLAKDR